MEGCLRWRGLGVSGGVWGVSEECLGGLGRAWELSGRGVLRVWRMSGRSLVGV